MRVILGSNCTVYTYFPSSS
uniref:Uncharacterized protein n=1 Tax=Rhizophora mucronata TaxID=61149 RepID=A0A2P2PTU5_RHIMU